MPGPNKKFLFCDNDDYASAMSVHHGTISRDDCWLRSSISPIKAGLTGTVGVTSAAIGAQFQEMLSCCLH